MGHPHKGTAMNQHGTFNDFDSQMFTLSFCCHSQRDVRLQWFVNGWNLRLVRLQNFVKIWPEFFEKSARNVQAVDKIESELLQQWKLPLTDKEYELYEKDMLRFASSSH